MAKRQVLAPAARQDLRQILNWSEWKFGHAAAARYRALVKQAADLTRKGSKESSPFSVVRHRPDGSLEISRIFAKTSAISTPWRLPPYMITADSIT